MPYADKGMPAFLTRATKPKVVDAAVSESQAHVLVADDEPNILRMIRTHLEQAGYFVTAVSNGTHALEHVSQHKCDVLIADVMMPGLNGFELFKEVRKNPNLAGLPFVFLSYRSSIIEPETPIDFGGKVISQYPHWYVTKPIHPKMLIVIVDDALGNGDHHGLKAWRERWAGNSIDREFDIPVRSV